VANGFTPISAAISLPPMPLRRMVRHVLSEVILISSSIVLKKNPPAPVFTKAGFVSEMVI
jgi:hypothetical protein